MQNSMAVMRLPRSVTSADDDIRPVAAQTARRLIDHLVTRISHAT